MKKLGFFMLLLAAASMWFTGCEKDSKDIKEVDVYTKILGKWPFISETYTVHDKDGAFVGTDKYLFEPDDYMEFKINGTGLRYENINSNHAFTYSIGKAGKELIITFLNNSVYPPHTYEIKALTDTDLVLYEEEINQAGYKSVVELVFKK